MDERFPGRLTLPDGEEAEVEVAIDVDTVRLSIQGRDVGTWPIRFCKVSRDQASSFTLSLDGELVEFEPVHLQEFAIAAAQGFRFAGLAERINVIRGIPGTVPDEAPAEKDADEPDVDRPTLRRLLPVALVLGVLVVAVVAGVVLANRGPRVTGEAGPRPTATAAGSLSPFQLGPRDLVARWNQVAAELAAPTLIEATIPDGPFEAEVAPGVILQARLDRSGSVEAMVLSAPADTPSDVLVESLDVAIATAAPRLDADGRTQVLVALGIDADRARVATLAAEVERGGLRFSIAHLEGLGSVLFTITEA